MGTAEILLQYKEKIEEEKANLVQLRAEKKVVQKQLKEEFGLSDLDAAQKRLVRVKRQIVVLEKDFKDKLEEIQQAYPL